MRKLIIYIFLLGSFAGQSQVDYFTLTKDNGTKIGMVEHLAPANPNGKKDPVIIWLHGIDANRSAPISTGDTTRIAVVTNKGPLRLVRDGTPLPLFQKPGTIGADYCFRWNIVAPQNRPKCTTCIPSVPNDLWDGEIIDKAYEYVMAHPEKWDTSLVMAVCYSLGAGGGQSNLKRLLVRKNTKYAVIIGPGYNISPDYPTINAEAINIDVFTSVADELVAESIPDGWVNGLKANSPITIPNYFRFVTVPATATTNPQHDGIEVFIARDTTNGDTQLMTNGSTWTRTENIYQRGLRFFGPRRKHSAFPLIFFIPFFPKRRKRLKKAA